MHAGFFYKKITTVFILSILVLLLFNQISYGYSFWPFKEKPTKVKITGLKHTIEAKRKETRAKIHELKQKEKIEVNKLYESQNKLEETKSDINVCENRLSVAKNNIQRLQNKIEIITQERQKTAKLAGERLKQIYKGERVSILHLIFAANNVNTFLDRIYYQKRLAVYDKNLLNNLREKTKELFSVKQSVEAEKNNILNTLNIMNDKKRQISMAISTSQFLINKLRTDRATYESAERELAQQSSALTAMLARTINSSSEKIQTSSGFIRPIAGIITSPFGWRKHPIFGSRSFHTGVDIAAAHGTPIKASNSGKVIYTGWYGGYGKVVIVNHGEYRGTSTSTLYAHMSSIAVGTGNYVKRGQVVGYEGTTGYSTGPHLHFEVRLQGNPTNPLNYIR